MVAFTRGILTSAAQSAGGAPAAVPPAWPEGAKARPTKEAAEATAARGTVCRERADRGPIAATRVGRDLFVVAGPYRRQGDATTSEGSCDSVSAWFERWLGAVARPKPAP
jgi:hypothetical protein